MKFHVRYSKNRLDEAAMSKSQDSRLQISRNFVGPQFDARVWIIESHLLLRVPTRFPKQFLFSERKQNFKKTRVICEHHEHKGLRLNPSQTKLFPKIRHVSIIMDLSSFVRIRQRPRIRKPRSGTVFSILNC